VGLMNTRWFAPTSCGRAVALAALTLLAGGLAGCKNKGAAGICPAVGDCGGNPTGIWQVEPELTCHFPVVTRMAQNYANTAPYFEPETGATPPAVTSGTWCWDLSFDKDGNLATPKVPVPDPDIVVSGTVTFGPDQSYLYTLTATSTTRAIHLARSCLGVNGANLGPGGAPTTCGVLADKMNASIPGSNTTYMNVLGTPSFRCVESGDGCDCDFDFTEQDPTGSAVGDRGTWVVEKGTNVIHHYSISGQGNFFETSPTRRSFRDATFCQRGDTLELSGANGTALALKAGTRTLTLKRVPPEPDAGSGGSGGTGGAIGAAGAGGGAGGAGGGEGDGSQPGGDGPEADGATALDDAGAAGAD
jgi:hypothetical protein